MNTINVNNMLDFTRRNFLFVLLMPIMALIFGSWDILYLISDNNNFEITNNVTSSVFQSINSWIPLIVNIEDKTLLVQSSGIGTGGFYPHITLWVFGSILKIFGTGGLILITF